MSTAFSHATIIGTGLIGASLGAAGRRAGVLRHVVGVGRGKENLRQALALGRVDAVAEDPVKAVTEADLVVLATPVDTALELLPALAAAASQRTVFTDVGSVKAPIVACASACGIAERFVGAHPIAGGTATGAESADPDLFRGKTAVLTPTQATGAVALDRVRGLWRSVGAEVVEMLPVQHDEILALTSHLPQFVAFALAAAVARAAEIPPGLVGSGFHDTTRLAMSDHEMWLAIARLNRDQVVSAMRAFERAWRELGDALEGDDEAVVRAVMTEARRFKERSRR